MPDTIRGHIYRRQLDIRSTHDPHPILIPAGWTYDLIINGHREAGRDGLHTHQAALTMCLRRIGQISSTDTIPTTNDH